jgi:hypothetical protein
VRTEPWDRRTVIAYIQRLGVDELVVEAEPGRLVADRILAGLKFAHDRGIGLPRRLLFTRGDSVADQIALYLPRTDTLAINLVDSLWDDPEARMRRFARERLFPTANPDFPVLHELGHREHYLSLSDPFRWVGLRGIELDWTERRIIRREVGINAAQNPLELVADVFSEDHGHDLANPDLRLLSASSPRSRSRLLCGVP